jgi:protein-tyrosine phosphatase
MWVWTLNWGKIRNDILIGSCPIRPADIDRICDGNGVEALLSLQTVDCRAALGINYELLTTHASSRGVVMVNAPMRDFDGEEQRKRLPGAVSALCDLLRRGHRTYVHCTAGINRGPLLVLTYLSLVEGVGVGEAMDMIRRGRPQASPYWDAYHGCRQDALGAHERAIALRAWDLSRDNPAETAESNWFRAERDILSQAFAPKEGP